MTDVLGLTKAGFSEGLILTKVKRAGAYYDLTTERMIYLKNQGGLGKRDLRIAPSWTPSARLHQSESNPAVRLLEIPLFDGETIWVFLNQIGHSHLRACEACTPRGVAPVPSWQQA
jgi:hypothetical protein